MANTMVSFKRGSNLSNLAIADGQFIINTSERSIYVDVGNKRLRIGDFVSVANTDALPASANETALYYVEDINCLAKWNGSGWTQINRDSGAVNFTVTGDGNAITNVSYDAKTRTLTLTKDVTFTTPAVVDGKISDKVGSIDGTVKDYVDKKTSGIATDASLSALTKRVDAAESDIDALQAATAEGGSVTLAIADAKKAGTDAQSALNTYKTTNDAAVKANTDAISAINNETTGILAQAKTYADGKDVAIAAAKKAGDDAQADVDALEAKVGTVANGKTVVELIGTAQAAADAAQYDVNTLSNKVGTVTEGKTVVQMIADAQAAATYDDTQIKANIKANADAIGILNGTGAGSVSKQVADAVASIVADAPEAYDTLKEISDWISSHASDASDMNSQINTNKTNIADLTALVGTLPETATSSTVVDYIDEAIDALKIGDYAKATELASAVTRISTAEGKITTLEGQVATINGDASTAGSIAKASADTLASAKSYADGLNTTMGTRVKAIEDKGISNGANKVEKSDTNGNIKIDGVETVVYTHPAEHAISEVTGLQSALDAKATVTALNATNANVTANAEAIDNLDSGKADKAITLKGYGITDAYTKTETYTQAQVDALLAWDEF